MHFFRPLRSPKTTAESRYQYLRALSLAGILLLAFYAAAYFPGFYDTGPTLHQWSIIGSVMLSAIVLFHFERACSSRGGLGKHDWNSSGGSLYAFSFGRFFCKKCGAKRILVSIGKQGNPSFLTPGKAAPGNAAVGFYCPCCKDSVDETLCRKPAFSSSRIRAGEYAEIRRKLRDSSSYRLSKEYTRRYILVTFILFLAEISSFYLARSRAVMLLIPLVVGYLLFVSAYNMLTALVTKYYVTDTGVIQRIPWGYSQYTLSAKSALVRFRGDRGEDAWGLYTDKENLMISPIITNYAVMLDDLKAICLKKSITIVEQSP